MKEMSFKSGVKGRVICGENGFIFNAFINLEPVQRSEDGCDMRRFRSFNHSMSVCVQDSSGYCHFTAALVSWKCS